MTRMDWIVMSLWAGYVVLSAWLLSFAHPLAGLAWGAACVLGTWVTRDKVREALNLAARIDELSKQSETRQP